MFKETPPAINEIETVIGPSVKVEGDFVTEGNMIVEGTICGSIKTSKNLKIGPPSQGLRQSHRRQCSDFGRSPGQYHHQRQNGADRFSQNLRRYQGWLSQYRLRSHPKRQMPNAGQ